MPNPFNCLSKGETLDQFESFYVAPVRDDESDPERGTQMVQCEPGWAEIWTVYGIDAHGESRAVHDELDVGDAVGVLRRVALQTKATCFYRDEKYGNLPRRPVLDWTAISDALKDQIHEDLDDDPANDDLDTRAEAFDGHALAQVQEAFWSICEERVA